MSGDLFPVSLPEMIHEIERELAYRDRVYPRLIAERKMRFQAAEQHMGRMRAVLSFLLKHNEPQKKDLPTDG